MVLFKFFDVIDTNPNEVIQEQSQSYQSGVQQQINEPVIPEEYFISPLMPGLDQNPVILLVPYRTKTIPK